MTTVSGIVRDTQQNAIAGASVTVKYRKPLVGYDGGAAVQNVRQFTTAGDGALTMADLVPGYYDITIAIVANGSTTVTVLQSTTMTVLAQSTQTLESAIDPNAEPITPNLVQRAEAAATSAAASSAAAGAASGRLDVGSFAQLATKFVYADPSESQEIVADGDVVLWRGLGLAYEVVDASTPAPIDYTGSGGVRFKPIGAYITPEQFGATGDGGEEGAALEAMFSVSENRVIYWGANVTYRSDRKLIMQSGMTFVGNGARVDFSNMPTDTTGGFLSLSGAAGTPVAIDTIAVSTAATEVQTVTVTTDAAHGRSVADEVLISSDDPVDIGHDAAQERRGQFVTVKTVASTAIFTTIEPLRQTLPTNPVVTPVAWAKAPVIKGGFTVKGPGRRGSDDDAGPIGMNLTYCRDGDLGGFSTDGVDMQAVSLDNCRRVHSRVMVFRFAPKGSGNETIQYGLTPKNATSDCYWLGVISYGGKHGAFDRTRNNNPGIGHNCRLERVLAMDSWDAAVAMHGNAQDCSIGSVKVYNSLYGVNIRAPGWRVDDIYGENVSEVLRLTDNPNGVSVGSVRGKNVVYVARATDTAYIGTTEAGNITIDLVEGENVSGNTVQLGFDTIPVFTQADAAVTAGTTTSMSFGDLSLLAVTVSGRSGNFAKFETVTASPSGATGYISSASGSTLYLQRVTGTFASGDTITGGTSGATGTYSSASEIDMYNNGGALVGSEVTFDPDGGGSAGTVTRVISGHTYSGGTNTITWATAVGTAPNTSATYTIRSFVNKINIGRIVSKNAAFADLAVSGNVRYLRVGPMDVSSASVPNQPSVLIATTATQYAEDVSIGPITAVNKNDPSIGAQAVNVRYTLDKPSVTEFRGAPVMAGDVSRAYMATAIAAGFVPIDGATYTLDGLQYLGETGATDIDYLPGLVLADQALALSENNNLEFANALADDGDRPLVGYHQRRGAMSATASGLAVMPPADMANPLSDDGVPAFFYDAGAKMRLPADIDRRLVIIPGYGQSLAGAANDDDTDTLTNSTATYPDHALMPIIGPAPGGSYFDQLVALRDVAGTGFDTRRAHWLSPLANTVISEMDDAFSIRPKMALFSASQGGRSYDDLMPGNEAFRFLAKGLRGCVVAARKMGLIPWVPAVFWVQGEQDRQEGLSLERIRRDRQAMAREVTSLVRSMTLQPDDPIIFISQPNNAVDTDELIPAHHLAPLSLDGEGNIRLLPPHYDLPMSSDGVSNTGVHPSSAGYQTMGQRMAGALLDEVFGRGYTATKIMRAEWESTSIIRLYYNARTEPIVLDVSGDVVTVPTWTGSLNGFQFFDGSGTPPTISSMTVEEDSNTAGTPDTVIRIVLSGASTGPAPRLHYATRNDGTGANSGQLTGPRGCIRDSSTPPFWAAQQVIYLGTPA